MIVLFYEIDERQTDYSGETVTGDMLSQRHDQAKPL